VISRHSTYTTQWAAGVVGGAAGSEEISNSLRGGGYSITSIGIVLLVANNYYNKSRRPKSRLNLSYGIEIGGAAYPGR